MLIALERRLPGIIEETQEVGVDEFMHSSVVVEMRPPKDRVERVISLRKVSAWLPRISLIAAAYHRKRKLRRG